MFNINHENGLKASGSNYHTSIIIRMSTTRGNMSFHHFYCEFHNNRSEPNLKILSRVPTIFKVVKVK